MSDHSSQYLCLPCQNITISALQLERGYQHHASLSDLEASAKQCTLCSFISQAILKNCGVADSKTSLFTAMLKGLPGSQIGEHDAVGLMQSKSILYIDRRASGANQRGIGIGRLRIYSEHETLAAKAGIPPGRHLSPRGDAGDAFAQVKEWLHDCTHGHERCHPHAVENPKLPTRVLDIRGPAMKLLHTGNSNGNYIALSHCWGKAQLITTTKRTISDRIQGIQMNDLPRTYQDAVIICRELCINYLWIDSLCIIQDDEHDWIQEAATMGNIYANSYCTIAATSAKDSSEGCLGKREFPSPIQVYDKISNAPFWISDCGNIDRDVNVEPLNTRAWVLQERILAPRTLHYTSHQIFWECFTLTEPEDRSMNYVDRKHNFLPDFIQKEGNLNGIPSSWYYLIEEYSQLNMTFAKDKLVAISGLVNRLQWRVKSDYLYGLWSGEMHKGLFWMPANEKLNPSSLWRAPTWSWAAYDGVIQYYQDAVWSNVSMEMEILELPRSSTRDPSNVSMMIRTKIRTLTKLGPLVPREELVPITLGEYTTSYGMLDEEGDEVGWVSLDMESESPDLQKRSIVCALISSCEVNNNGYGNKFLFGTRSDFFISEDFEGDEDWGDGAEEEVDVDGDKKLIDDEDYDRELINDEVDDKDDYKEWHANESFDGDSTTTITSCYFIALESIAVSSDNFRRIGMGVLKNREWIEEGTTLTVRIE